MSETKTVTVREFIEAIRKNGLPKIEGDFFEFESGFKASSIHDTFSGIVGACAFGQGLINLNLAIHFRVSGDTDPFIDKLYRMTYRLNDGTDMSFDEIADKLLEKYASNLDDKMTFNVYDYTPHLTSQLIRPKG